MAKPDNVRRAARGMILSPVRASTVGPFPMKPRPVDECLAASTDLIAKTRNKLAQLQFSVETCLTSIEVSADAIAASQALLAKLDGGAFNGLDADAKLKKSPASEQTIEGSP